jgi:hypothetical protein
MERQASTIYRQLGIAPVDWRIDGLWTLFGLSAALLLYTWQLGDLPLSDGNEAQIALVARGGGGGGGGGGKDHKKPNKHPTSPHPPNCTTRR